MKSGWLLWRIVIGAGVSTTLTSDFGVHSWYLRSQPSLLHSAIASIPSPAPPRRNTKMPTQSVIDFGAIPNDSIDDTFAIQQAIDATAALGGGDVYFPTGNYLISIRSSARSSSAVVIRSNVSLRGDGSTNSVIQLADQQGNYDSLFGAETPSTPITNFGMYNLGIDGNGVNNPVNGEADLQGTGLFRHALRIYAGDHIYLEGNRFFNQTNVNTITLNGDSVSDATIVGNVFERIGGGSADYDHSTIYTNGTRIAIANNTFSSYSGPGTNGARTAIEIHGSDQTISGNTITGYLYGINATGTGVASGSNNQLYTDNVITDVGVGIVIWSNYEGQNQSGPALSNVTIQNNQISINVEGWRGFFDGEPRAGIAFKPNRDAPIQNLYITGNQISFSNFTGASAEADYFSSGITLVAYQNSTVPVQGIYILNNTIENLPGAGIYFNGVVDQGEIRGNQIINSGRSENTIDPIYRSGIYLTNQVNSLQVNDNLIIDNQPAQTLQFGIIERTNCLGNCSATNNNLQVASGAQLPIFDANLNQLGVPWTYNIQAQTNPATPIPLPEDTSSEPEPTIPLREREATSTRSQNRLLNPEITVVEGRIPLPQ